MITETSGVHMQVLQLEGPDISVLWDSLKKAIVAGLPPATEVTDKLTSNILSALVRGDMWCWTIEEGKVPSAVVTATVTQDICSRTRNLLVYSVWFSEAPKSEAVQKLVRVLIRFAMTQGCSRLCGYTRNKAATDLLLRLKGVEAMVYMEASING